MLDKLDKQYRITENLIEDLENYKLPEVRKQYYKYETELHNIQRELARLKEYKKALLNARGVLLELQNV